MIFISLDIPKQMFLFSFKSDKKIKVMHIWATSSMPLKFHIVNLVHEIRKVRYHMTTKLIYLEGLETNFLMKDKSRWFRQKEETLLKGIQDTVFSFQWWLHCITVLSATEFSRFGNFGTGQTTQYCGEHFMDEPLLV